MGGQLLEEVKAFNRKINGCVRVAGKYNESFATGVGVKKGCMISPWLFNFFMDGHKKKM